MGFVWRLPLRPVAKLVLLALADYANEEGEHVYPSVRTLTRKTDVSGRQIQRLLREFEERRWLKCVKESTPTSPRVYRLDAATLKALGGVRQSGVTGSRPLTAGHQATDEAGRGDRESPPRVTGATGGGDSVSPNPSVTTSVKKHPPGEPSEGARQPTTTAVALIDHWRARFEAKVGEFPVVTQQDAVLLHRLAKQFGVEQATVLVDAMFDSPDPWYGRAGYTIGVLHKSANRLLANANGARRVVSPRTEANMAAAQQLLDADAGSES